MKKEIRKRILEKRNKLNIKEVEEKSNKIKNILLKLNHITNSNTIHCYISTNNEVGTKEIITKLNKSKEIIIPYIKNDLLECSKFNSFEELKKNKCGIMESINPVKFIKEKIDLIIIPGLAFDKKGNRIGYGKGYYDKFLSKLNKVKIGIAYDFQILNNVPHEEHDIKMDYIITNKEIITCLQK